MKEFLETKVADKWSQYLASISERERSSNIINKGSQFTLLQFMKDVQKLYRLIFRHRFHRWDKRRDKNQGPIVRWILSELGFESEDYNYSEVFLFFYSVLKKLRKINPTVGYEEEKNAKTFTKVFEEESGENFKVFVNHPLARLFLIFFIVNFGASYIREIKGLFKTEVKKIITHLAEYYSISVSLPDN